MFSPELVAWELIRQPKTVWACSLQNFHANFLDPPNPPETSARVQSCRNTATCRAWGAHGRAPKGSLLRERSILGSCGRIMEDHEKMIGGSVRQLFFHGKCWFDHVQLRKTWKTHIVWNDDLMKRWFHQGREWIRKPGLSIGGLPQNSDTRLFEMVSHVNIPALD